MIEPEDELELRNRVRRSLESIVTEAGVDEQEAKEPPAQPDVGRLQAILTEETEAFYQRMGLVKHVSRTGRAHWVTPEEEAHLGSRRRKKRRHRDPSFLDRIDRKVLFVWVATSLIAALLLAYLIKTEVIG